MVKYLVVIKIMGSGGRLSVLVSLIIRCVTLGKLLFLSMPESPHP